MQDFDLFLLFQHTVDHAIDMWLVAPKKVSKVTVLGSRWGAIRVVSQRTNDVPQAAIPGQGSVGRSRSARGMSLTRYAIRGFKFREKLLGVAPSSSLGIVQALTDTFGCVGLGGNIEQALIGFGVLNDRRGRSLRSAG
jgi:hypothetical protein